MRNYKTFLQMQDDFYTSYLENCTKEYFAEQVYILIHSIYTEDDIIIKTELGLKWKEKFNKYMNNETFAYIERLEPGMLKKSIVDNIKSGEEIIDFNYICKTIVACEFDLWNIERSKKGMNSDGFEFYMSEKYGEYIKIHVRNFKKFDLKYINNFNNITKLLEPYYDNILKFLEVLTVANHSKIEFKNENASRVMEYKSNQNQLANKDKKYRENIQVTNTEQMRTNESEIKNISQKYQIIIDEKDERISKLENDIKEFKRQRDEAREYSANQYDRGIKDLFSAMNDIRYGKIIDYLYSLVKGADFDINLVSYLDNLFMILENFGITPIVENDDFKINDENLVKEFNLDFDKSNYQPEKVRLKYVGWQYKDVPIEKPMLTLEEE